MSALSSTELCDPLAGTWNVVGDSGEGSVMHSATLLPNGKVLVAGGNGGGVGGNGVLATASSARSLRPSVVGHGFDDAAGDRGLFHRGTRSPPP